MTRFEQEISGILDEQVARRKGEENRHFWQRHAETEVANAVAKANTDAVVDENGAICWKSNGNYLMDDLCEMLEYAGYNFSREATKKARSIQNDKFIEAYRRKQANKVYSEEEMCEMRAAFGAGTTVVDVITGRTIKL